MIGLIAPDEGPGGDDLRRSDAEAAPHRRRAKPRRVTQNRRRAKPRRVTEHFLKPNAKTPVFGGLGREEKPGPSPYLREFDLYDAPAKTSEDKSVNRATASLPIYLVATRVPT